MLPRIRKAKRHRIHHNAVIVHRVQRRWGGQTALCMVLEVCLGGETGTIPSQKVTPVFLSSQSQALPGCSSDPMLPSCGQKGGACVTTGSTQASTSWVSRSSSPWWLQADSEVLLPKELPRGAGKELEGLALHDGPWLAFSKCTTPRREVLALKRLKSLFTYTICS